MLKNEDSLEVVRAIVGMAHGLRMQVVAEGCESVDELQALWRMECEYVQGFMLSDPLDSQGAVEFASSGPVLTWGPVLTRNPK